VKPSDAFLGVMDFFSSLVPGAVAAFLLLNQNNQLVSFPEGWPITWGSTGGWAVFLVGAYLLGHGITAIGSLLLDRPVYDRLYVRWQRSKAVVDRPQRPLPLDATCWTLLRDHVSYLENRTSHLKLCLCNPWKQEELNNKDALLSAASKLKKCQLQSLGISPDGISNTFWWAGTVVRLRSPSGTTEVEALQAQSKLFRSIIIILLAMAIWCWPFETWVHLGVWLAAIALSLWRYCKLRWDATERTYEYYLALAIPSIGSPAESRIPPSPPGTPILGPHGTAAE
jgi:hypothetical protein